MSRDYPDWVDPWKAGQGERQFAGTASLAQLARVTDRLARDDGEVSFRVRFELNTEGRPQARVEVAARPWQRCQRSLEPYQAEVSGESTVGLTADPDDAARMPGDREPYLMQSARVHLLDLVEEELLLALPLVPVNPDARLPASASAGETVRSDEEENPFAALDALRSKPGD